MINFYLQFKKEVDENIVMNEKLSGHCTWRIGGLAKYWYEAKTKEKLISAVRAVQKHNIKYFILGGGSNVLFSDAGFDGLVIKNSTSLITMRGIKSVSRGGETTQKILVEADSGVVFNRFVRYCLDEGLSGVEPFLGQPGTIGGAVYINAHFLKQQKFISDILVFVRVLNLNGVIEEIPVELLQMGYDESRIQKTRELVLSAVFSLERSTKEKVWSEANKTVLYRQESQPQGFPSAGCTFRNVSQAEAMIGLLPNQTRSAGYLIDQCGLKGLISGGAQISEKHANFIINKNNATANDVKKLIAICKKKVREKFGILLKEEIIIVES